MEGEYHLCITIPSPYAMLLKQVIDVDPVQIGKVAIYRTTTVANDTLTIDLSSSSIKLLRTVSTGLMDALILIQDTIDCNKL